MEEAVKMRRIVVLLGELLSLFRFNLNLRCLVSVQSIIYQLKIRIYS